MRKMKPAGDLPRWMSRVWLLFPCNFQHGATFYFYCFLLFFEFSTLSTLEDGAKSSHDRSYLHFLK